MLCSGYTQIRKANYASRGVYFQAFTSLSIESLHAIECIVRQKQLFEVPYFMEIFRVFYNDDSYMKGRKTIQLI